jgi:hypothetical protein
MDVSLLIVRVCENVFNPTRGVGTRQTTNVSLQGGKQFPNPLHELESGGKLIMYEY